MTDRKVKYTQDNFPDIFESYKDKIYLLVHRMTADKEVAEDITQETFIKCYENLDKFRGESHIYTWLYAVAKNNSLRFLEKQKKTSAQELEQLLSIASDSKTDIFDENEKSNYINQVKEGCLLGLLKTLSFNQRIAFILNVLQNRSIEETAQVIDKTESATRTLVHRARKNIKDFLCKNCSLYNEKNSCKCENMINFSLKQGWIKYDDKYSFNLSEKIGDEIKDSKKIFELYASLPEHKLSERASDKIKNKDFLIFSDKKVK